MGEHVFATSPASHKEKKTILTAHDTTRTKLPSPTRYNQSEDHLDLSIALCKSHYTGSVENCGSECPQRKNKISRRVSHSSFPFISKNKGESKAKVLKLGIKSKMESRKDL